MPFHLPPNGLRFYTEVVERSLDLIQVGIWNGLHPARLKTWLNNFSTDEEKYFAGCMLDNLIYRSEDQTVAPTTQVFHRALPDVTRAIIPPIGKVDDWLALLSSNVDPGARLVAVLKPDDPPGKSGDIIARLLKRGFRLNPKFVVQPEGCRDLEAKGISTFIFVDDFLGTGHQFDEVLTASGADALLAKSYCVYAPLTAHIDGIHYLRATYPQLQVCCGELLDWSHSLFHDECAAFNDGVNSAADGRRFYHELLHQRGVSFDATLATSASVTPSPASGQTAPYTLSPHNRRGYGCLELTYAFHHSIPDNCLPALWWSHSSAWSPLFNR